ncbi:hypothetical protein HPB47_015966 [Ixodes persulcatus]|uniref:Uncharacterized protein n=1 Tax=Ixodes persulcatus TaxID=34615 RepID=A0AC60QS21_IXOPE|nr:hypothetical protein HPB47_015966 [Ixodes persulcatus]
MVVVTCADGLEITMANLKSAVAFSRVPLRFILYADVENIKRLQDRIMQWPASALERITYDLRLVMFTKKDFETWKKLFVPCSTQRLFLPVGVCFVSQYVLVMRFRRPLPERTG